MPAAEVEACMPAVQEASMAEVMEAAPMLAGDTTASMVAVIAAERDHMAGGAHTAHAAPAWVARLL